MLGMVSHSRNPVDGKTQFLSQRIHDTVAERKAMANLVFHENI